MKIVQGDEYETKVWDVRDVAPKKRMFCVSFRIPAEKMICRKCYFLASTVLIGAAAASITPQQHINMDRLFEIQHKMLTIVGLRGTVYYPDYLSGGPGSLSPQKTLMAAPVFHVSPRPELKTKTIAAPSPGKEETP
ncbi:tRNA(m(1)G37)methyltransferase [Ciborinia camelliae]|nr:tRNA(m(1)G37)methyltransferase [Ciborinia camelliae]